MTFGELTQGCTPGEVDALAWHLASYRARKTYDALKPPAPDPLAGITAALEDREAGRER